MIAALTKRGRISALGPKSPLKLRARQWEARWNRETRSLVLAMNFFVYRWNEVFYLFLIYKICLIIHLKLFATR